MQRKQRSRNKTPGKDYQSRLQFISCAVINWHLKQQWTGLNAASREAVGNPSKNPAAAELITALLAEIRELEADFSHQDDSAFRQRKNANRPSPVPKAAAGSAIRYARDQRLSADERSE